MFVVAWLALCGAVDAQTVDVMHWWTSTSERAAADQLAAALSAQGLIWQDAAVPGGGGVAAVKVLKSRMISGEAPAAAQVIGKTLTDWADLGLVLPLDTVAQRGRWSQTLFPTVLQVVSHDEHVIAAPLGVHRINSLLYQRKLFVRLGLSEPRSWADIEAAATKLRAAGIRPVAWSDEPWQVATVFEAVLLAEAGAPLYRELVMARQPQLWDDVRVERALARLRWLRGLNGVEAKREVSWTDNARALLNQQAGMLLNGDWVKGELIAWGARADEDFGCLPVPSTQGVHLFSIDTLAMLVGTKSRAAEQEKAAEIVTSAATQRAYNRIKGSVPVRQDIDTTGMDSCARDSWVTFADRRAERVPSLAHRMAADEATKDAITDAVQRFLMNPLMSPAEARVRLAAVVRSVLTSRRIAPP